MQLKEPHFLCFKLHENCNSLLPALTEPAITNFYKNLFAFSGELRSGRASTEWRFGIARAETSCHDPQEVYHTQTTQTPKTLHTYTHTQTTHTPHTPQARTHHTHTHTPHAHTTHTHAH